MPYQDCWRITFGLPVNLSLTSDFKWVVGREPEFLNGVIPQSAPRSISVSE